MKYAASLVAAMLLALAFSVSFADAPAYTFPMVDIASAQTITGAKTFTPPLKVGTATTADALADTLMATSATTQKALVLQSKASQSANVFEVQSNDGDVKVSIGSAELGMVYAKTGHFFGLQNLTTSSAYGYYNNGFTLGSAVPITWGTSAPNLNDRDTGLGRASAGVVEVNNGVLGTLADLKVKGALTAGTMTQANSALVRKTTHNFTWTNAQVTALPTTAGDIAVCTLPAKTVVTNAYIIITGAAVGPATVSVALGRTSATYIDYIVASDAKAAANTVYGDASGERGTNLTGYDMPSYTGTTTVNAHFISTVANLSTVTGSTGTIILETMLVP